MVIENFTAKFKGLTRLLDLLPFETFKPVALTRLVLTSPPPQVLQKVPKEQIHEAT